MTCMCQPDPERFVCVHVDPDDPKFSVIRVQFGDYLLPRIAPILEAWVVDVRADPRVPIALGLPEEVIKDHIPSLLKQFVAFLRTGSDDAGEAVRNDAATHGTERWGQGYSIQELVWEIYRLRKILQCEVEEFARIQDNEVTVFSVASRSVDAFLNDQEARSIEKYVEEGAASMERSNHARLRLLRSISHEVRNMLNSVGIASALLEAGDAEPVEPIRATLERNCDHMTEVVDDLLGLSNVLSPHSRIEAALIEPSTLLSSLDATYRSQAEDKGLRYTSTTKGDMTGISTDGDKVSTIARHILTNAIQHTARGEVHVSFERMNPQEWAVVIRDTGVGIAKEDRKHIFSEFYRAQPESLLRGSGLGLAIVAALVELLGGSISLESREGEGSMFRILLPTTHPVLHVGAAG